MIVRIQRFLRSDSGAVSAEVVVVTAAMVALALAVLQTLADGALDSAAAHNANLEASAPLDYVARPD